MNLDAKTRFMKYVEIVTEGGCWIWMSGVNKRGYGRFFINKNAHGAHRVSYELFVGKIPTDKMVLHRCDVPSCVNPHHLFIGDKQANMDDMVKKNRQSKGEKHGTAKLTEHQVKSILASDESLINLASKYNVSYSQIWSIKNGKKWKYIERNSL